MNKKFNREGVIPSKKTLQRFIDLKISEPVEDTREEKVVRKMTAKRFKAIGKKIAKACRQF